MATFKTNLSVLQASATKYASLPVLKVPVGESTGKSWKDITFANFQKDVEVCARYWANEFSKADFSEQSVVGLWLRGTSYLDLVHIWGLSRAGFVPQVISLRMTDPSVAYELLGRTNAVALIYDPTLLPFLGNGPVPTWLVEDVLGSDLEHLPPPRLWTPSQAEDIVMIYHTSGSTSGSPKLVPVTAKWLDYSVTKMSQCIPPVSPHKQQVTVASGSFCHMATALIFLYFVRQGSCFVLPTELPYKNSELRQMINECELTDLAMFPAFISKVFQEARHDPSLLTAIQGLDRIIYGGGLLDGADEKWALEQGLNLLNLFASTEVGILLLSRKGQKEGMTYLETLPESRFEFLPLSDDSGPGPRLLELVVPPESPDCPAPPLRSLKDGKFHTGDLFIEVAANRYLSQGRNDDWIKMEMALRCDTGSIEMNAMDTCGHDLIGAAVVVGVGRPSPVLVVEPKDITTICSEPYIERLKNEIFQRVSPFHKRRYMHERIGDPRFILVVPTGTLARTATKGNIQRKKVQENLKDELDKIY
ncbi:hypothetical protein BGZ63DRAFT_489404 [Mariannaea sp. PMI_226]|nr:hypothetical protein BGZ63DRAFT_489404 [Mariannaea sp. PMI_226]